MDICGHLLQPNSIIGIGPLYQKEHPDAAMRNLYRPVRLEFEVHTTSLSISVQSDYFYVGSIDNDEKVKATMLYNGFREKYFLARADIARLLDIADTLDESK